MEISKKIKIEIQARELALEVLNNNGLDGLHYYSETLNLIVSQCLLDVEAKLAEIKASKDLSD